VRCPPPGFAAALQPQSQSYISSTGSGAPAQSGTVTEMQSQSLPNMPNTNSSNFMAQSTGFPVAPAIYDVPLFANANPFLAQASVLQQLMYYEYLLQHQPLMRSMVLDPAMAFLISQNISAASLANPFGVPMLNPSVLYSPPVTSCGISHLPVGINNNPELHRVDVRSPRVEAVVASEGEETVVSKDIDEQEQNKDDLVMEASNTKVSGFYSNSDQCDIVQEKPCGLESDPDVSIESKYVNEGEEPSPSFSTSSDDIYRYVNLYAVKGTNLCI
jgi:hypothetical protein